MSFLFAFIYPRECTKKSEDPAFCAEGQANFGIFDVHDLRFLLKRYIDINN